MTRPTKDTSNRCLSELNPSSHLVLSPLSSSPTALCLYPLYPEASSPPTQVVASRSHLDNDKALLKSIYPLLTSLIVYYLLRQEHTIRPVRVSSRACDLPFPTYFSPLNLSLFFAFRSKGLNFLWILYAYSELCPPLGGPSASLQA